MEARKLLPINQHEEQILEAVAKNRVVVVIGETGSGKTTQLAQILHRAGYTKDGMIGVTQPRRVAAVSVSRRVAWEMGVQLGDEVGYSIRFEDRTSRATRIKYLTDGCLLRECLFDYEFKQYSVIIVDEAHERSLNTDILLGLLKRVAQNRNPELKVIITSATLDGQKFSQYFYGCPVINVPGKLYPVQLLYSTEVPRSYLESAVETAIDVHVREPEGDILVFLTGQDEIEKALKMLEEKVLLLEEGSCLDVIVLPLHASLAPEVQARVFQVAPPNCRRIIVATNVAETSLTVDGVVYVIDPGFVKQRNYNPTTGIDSLSVVRISRVQATQRAGRAGRTRSGKCYRLYPLSAYEEEFIPATVPEIQRSSLTGAVLHLKFLDLPNLDILHFDFIDPPLREALEDALRQLFAIDAIGQDGKITALGRRIAELPLDPALGRTLLAAEELGCLPQALTVAAMLSSETIFMPGPRKGDDRKRLREDQQLPDGNKYGDHVQYLQIYELWKKNNFDIKWCRSNGLQIRSMLFAKDVRRQLALITTRKNFEDDDRATKKSSSARSLRKVPSGGHFGPPESPGKGRASTKPSDMRVSKRQAILDQRRALPISSVEGELVNLVKKNDTLVVIGETGSGKTTQLPQFLNSAGFCKGGMMVGITQPRRVAAITVATRVAEEMGVEVGKEVGYSIRFEDCTSSSTQLKYMTDGMLLREALLDPLLSRYSLIVIDEAHERTIHTDVLFGLLKGVQKRRQAASKEKTSEKCGDALKNLQNLFHNSAGKRITPLKLVVMSATLDTKGFTEYFNGAEAVYVQGRQFPVEIFYTFTPEADYLDAALLTTFQIHLEETPGDILLFLTGQEEIESMERLLKERASHLSQHVQRLLVVPIYAALPSEQQMRVFHAAPEGTRKVILATNIAETSLTIPGIRYVIDPGLVKAKAFNPRTGVESLEIVPVSKAQAQQRSGRAGREKPGKCFRLYTEELFRKLEDTTVPEIKRCNLANVVLQLKAFGIDDVLGFDFMDKPSRISIVKSLEHLYSLGALTDEGKLSDPIGLRMSRFPLEPMFAKAMLISCEMGCSEEMLATVSMMSVDSVFYAPRDKIQEANNARKRFVSVDGDHITFINVLRLYIQEAEEAGVSEGEGTSSISNINENKKAFKRLRSWCSSNFINARSLRRAVDIQKQIRGYVEGMGLKITSCGEDMLSFRRCLAASFFLNAARRQLDGTYRALTSGQSVAIHPSSVLFGKKPDCVVFNELVRTNRSYIRNITQVDSLWLPELAPHYYAAQG